MLINTVQITGTLPSGQESVKNEPIAASIAIG